MEIQEATRHRHRLPRLAPRPLLPKQVAPVSGSQLTLLCLPLPTVRVHYVTRGSYQPPYSTKKIDIDQFLNEVGLQSTQAEKRRRRLMLPEDESEDEPSGKWPLIDVQRNFTNSTKSPGLSEVYIAGNPELANNKCMLER